MPTIEELTDEIREVSLLVHSAQERSEEREIVIAAHQGVQKISEHYRELASALSEGDKMKLERQLGRRVTDLRRLASLLPRIGGIAEVSTPDRRVEGASSVGARRTTGVTWQVNRERAVPTGAMKVGGEVEAWCGPCEGLTNHNIVAMVGQTPKQVVCGTCGGRHGYRTTPARKSASPESAAVTSSSSGSSEAERKAERKAEELRALGRELASVDDVRLFDPKSRYKTGDVISHPEYGRGKVETVLRSSILVRFANSGLKSIMLS